MQEDEMPDTDGKRTELICTKVPEQIALDILHLAADEDRSVSEFIYLLIRESLYGKSARLRAKRQSTSVDNIDGRR